MKGMVMAGMMGLSLILAGMAIFSNSWLTSEDEDGTINNGLSNQEWIMDAESSEECDRLKACMKRCSKKQLLNVMVQN